MINVVNITLVDYFSQNEVLFIQLIFTEEHLTGVILLFFFSFFSDEEDAKIHPKNYLGGLRYVVHSQSTVLQCI